MSINKISVVFIIFAFLLGCSAKQNLKTNADMELSPCRYDSPESGDMSLAPLQVFDDGYWTYFKYGEDGTLNKNKLPVLYQVIDNIDTLLNTRVQGSYIIVETTAPMFTIRHGDKFLCVKNEKYKGIR